MKARGRCPGLAAVLCGFFVMGFCDIVGFSTSYVKREFQLSETVAGLLPSMVFLWFLLLSVPAAMAMNRIGRKNAVIAGNALTVAGLLLPPLCFTFPACLAAFALLGVGNTVLQVSLNPLLTDVAPRGRLTSALNAGQVIKAVSSFSGPFVALFAARRLGDWKMMFPVFAGVSVLSTLLLLRVRAGGRADGAGAGGGGGPGRVFSLLGDRKVLLFFFGIAAIVGVDVGLNTLAPKLLMERAGLGVEQAALGSSVYFVCRVAGAFVGTFLLARMRDRPFYLAHSVPGAFVLAGLAFARGRVPVLVLTGLAGYCFSSIFSVLYSQVMKHRPERANEISGLMITGVFGGAVAPPLMGFFADLAHSQTGSLAVVAVFALYLVACAGACGEEGRHA